MDDKRSALYERAKELFGEKGFKDTGIADITRAAGVSVGTFYNCYPSKDRLFLEIFRDENVRLMREITSSIDPDAEPAALIREMMERNMRGMMKSPILRQWFDPDAFGRIERIFREEDGLGAMDFLYRDFIALVEKWQAQGRMRSDIDSGMIMAIFGAIIRIGHHREEIGLEYFPALQEHLTGFVLRGLTEGCGAGRAEG